MKQGEKFAMIVKEKLLQLVDATLAQAFKEDNEVIESGCWEIIDNWWENKQRLMEFLKIPKCEYRRKLGTVNTSLSDGEKKKSLDYFIEMLGEEYGELGDFLDKEGPESFFNNEVRYGWEFDDGEIVPIGMKLLKTFKYFIKDKTELRFYQDLASQLIQENKLTGDLWVSVHPLDFLTMSENNYKWQTCQRLDGEFGAGCLSLMQDKSTFMFYITSVDAPDVRIKDLPLIWNNKKWRMICSISNNKNIIGLGREYPFNLTGTWPMICKMIPELQPYLFNLTREYLDYYDNAPLCYKYYRVGMVLKKMDDIVKVQKGNLAFCDLVDSEVFRNPQITFKINLIDPREDCIEFGHRLTCCRCGNDQVLSARDILCENCLSLKRMEDKNDGGKD